MNSQKQNDMVGKRIGIGGLMHTFSYSKLASTHSRDRMEKVGGVSRGWRRESWGQRSKYVRVFFDYTCQVWGY